MKLKISLLALVLTTALTGCFFIEPIVETYTLRNWENSEVLELSVSNPFGSIEVVPGDSVSVKVEKRGIDQDAINQTHVDAVLSGSLLDITTKYSDFGSMPWIDRAEVALTITLPETVALTFVRSVAGSVDIRGNFSVEGIEVESGSVTLSGANLTEGVTVGYITTQAGSIDVDGAYLLGPLSTTAGSVMIKNVLQINNITSVTGSISADFLGIAGDIYIKNDAGSINLFIPFDLPHNISSNISLGSFTRVGSFTSGKNTIHVSSGVGSVEISN